MSKKTLRKIVVDGETYLWRFSPAYECLDEVNRRYRCHDTFTAYAQENRRGPMRITFLTWECPMSGGPLRCGALIDFDNPDSGGINLHTPKWAATLIRAGIQRGWNARQQRTPYAIENGVQLLADLEHKAQ